MRLAADQEATQRWWDECRQDFELFTSQTVLNEAGKGDGGFAAARLTTLSGIPLLPDSHDAAELAKRLLREQIIPAMAADDAIHVALAAAHNMDHLLTWNCTHINNHRLRVRIERACAALGLRCPDICTPTELMHPGDL